MKESKLIVVVGSSNTDMVISADTFPRPGETLIGHDFMINHGGKGANQAVAATRMGGKVAFIAKLGNDTFSNDTFRMLEREGMDVSHVTQTTACNSGVAVITINSQAENSIIVYGGANDLLSEADIEDAEPLLKDATILLMQLETPLPTLVKAASMAKQHGAYVVLNPAPAPKGPLPHELMKHVDLLIPNETEASTISGIDISNDESAQQAMNQMMKLGVKDVIITVGSRGVLTIENGQLIRVPAFEAKAVDTTAAGDTFCGALCVALSEGKPLKEAIRFGNRASSITVTRKGAQKSIPYRREVEW